MINTSRVIKEENNKTHLKAVREVIKKEIRISEG